ncbi:hypothetical protein D3C81_2200320 [compost metagenome]
MMEPQPMLCQMPDPTKMVRNHSGFIRNWIGSPPNQTMIWLIRPSVVRKFTRMPHTTTVEIKWGR